LSFAYLKEPDAIYRESFATIRKEVDFSSCPEGVAEMAVRLMHSCGMTDLLNELAWHPQVVESGRAALQCGAPVLCDVRMVVEGVMRERLPAQNAVYCWINDPGVREEAKSRNCTRALVATERWLPELAGAVVVIGNAPTALFHLLEGIAEGWPEPAAILAFPVGFVGAAESKVAVAEFARVPFITLHGRRGGSAMAAAAVNALAIMGAPI
jgi:precorrin isomerase